MLTSIIMSFLNWTCLQLLNGTTSERTNAALALQFLSLNIDKALAIVRTPGAIRSFYPSFPALLLSFRAEYFVHDFHTTFSLFLTLFPCPPHHIRLPGLCWRC